MMREEPRKHRISHGVPSGGSKGFMDGEEDFEFEDAATAESGSAGESRGEGGESGAMEPGGMDEDLESQRDFSDIDPRDLRWSWVEIDTKALVHNVKEFKHRIGPRPMLLATVKADAYGHGAVACAKIALSAGATWLGVATVDEGIELREAGIDDPILLLSQPPETAIPALLAYHITPAVYTVEFALALGETAAANGQVADYHLAVNTGMNRIGVWFSDVSEFVNAISFHKGLNMQGVFTHFATADGHEDYAFKLQLKRFREAVAAIHEAGIDPKIVHCANSAAGIRYKSSYFDMVRLGISMYGLHPSNATYGMIDLRPVMSVHARVTAVNTPPVGEGVSYGLNYRSPGGVKIATLPIGYADGYSRQLSGRTNVLFKGKLLPQVGNICMDQCMFEVDTRSTLLTRAVDVEIGDEAIIIGRQGDQELTLDAMADQLGTINYELACRFGMRMPRIYV